MNRPFGPDTGLPRGPEHYWRQIKALADGFTVRQILDRSNGVGRVAVRRYVVGLVALGYVEPIGTADTGTPSRFKAALYRCIRPAVTAPVVHDGPVSGHHGQLSQQIWNAMRVLPQFSVAELAVAASTEEHVVKRDRAAEFVHGLRRAGLVRVVERSRRGNGGATPAIYALLRSANTGPKPPRVNKQRRGVFDPNKRAFIANPAPVSA